VIHAQAFFIWELLRIVLALSHLSDSFFSGKSFLEGQIAGQRLIRRRGVLVMKEIVTFVS